jgi:hypothetical protein
MHCESCGADVAERQAVHRAYLTSEAWGQVPSARVLDEIEQWCFACLTQYPHEPA